MWRESDRETFKYNTARTTHMEQIAIFLSLLSQTVQVFHLVKFLDSGVVYLATISFFFFLFPSICLPFCHSSVPVCLLLLFGMQCWSLCVACFTYFLMVCKVGFFLSFFTNNFLFHNLSDSCSLYVHARGMGCVCVCANFISLFDLIYI